MNPIGYEAECKKCGETFNPHGEDDLIHLVRVDGELCGGQGVMRGAWFGSVEGMEEYRDRQDEGAS